jgi:protein-S-isoprenylcysteine O-methyltransferase Ste14
MTLARHLFALVVLPGTVAVWAPLWIARRWGITFTSPGSAADILLVVAGIFAVAIGLALFVASLRRFVSTGRGTLAPWDPPRHLVVVGPYRYVRNPMISGVTFVAFGESLILRSWPHLLWALFFLANNLVWIPFYEEPHLERLFGDEYRMYSRHVRRFIPRLRPWSPSREDRVTFDA